MIVIYTTEVTHRLLYTFDTVFREYFRLPYALVTDPAQAPQDGFRLNYSRISVPGWFSVHREPLLFESGIGPQRLFISRIEDMPVLFQGSENCDLNFDVFASVFYLLSRYEEYIPHDQDEHGRYRSSNSILNNPVFQFSPVVETWLSYLKDKLLEREPALTFKEHTREVEFTFDIDQPFAYKGRRWLKILRPLAKTEGRNVLFAGKPDPYDTLPRIFSFLRDSNCSARFFFLLNDRGQHNSSVDPRDPLLKSYIQQAAKEFEIGIHPSYSALREDLLGNEKELLERLSGTRVKHSRQHFLRIKFPDYFRFLLHHGLSHDHSLGYPDTPGFRAGYSRPFRFFDLTDDRQTELWLHPFSFMDATFIYYLQSDTNQIIKKFLALSEQVSKVNGKLVTVSHNDLLGNDCPVDFWGVLKNCAG